MGLKWESKMKKLFQDNLKAGLFLGIIATFTSFTRLGGPIVGSIIGFFGYRKSRAALKEGKVLGGLGIVLNGLPILYLLFLLFILGYTMFVR